MKATHVKLNNVSYHQIMKAMILEQKMKDLGIEISNITIDDKNIKYLRNGKIQKIFINQNLSFC